MAKFLQVQSLQRVKHLAMIGKPQSPEHSDKGEGESKRPKAEGAPHDAAA